jgi:hypothetical protein
MTGIPGGVLLGSNPDDKSNSKKSKNGNSGIAGADTEFTSENEFFYKNKLLFERISVSIITIINSTSLNSKSMVVIEI